jgi:hypothetical protein
LPPAGKPSDSEKKLVGEWTISGSDLAKVPDVEVFCRFHEDHTLLFVLKKSGQKEQEARGTWKYANEKLTTNLNGRSVTAQCRWRGQDEFSTTAPGEPPSTLRRKKP